MSRTLTQILTMMLLAVVGIHTATALTIEVNFIVELTDEIPAELQIATRDYLISNIDVLEIEDTRFTVTSYRADETNTWAELYFVPSKVVESGWHEAYIDENTGVSLLAEQVTPGQWRVFFRDAAMQGMSVQSLPPTSFIDLSETVGLQALALRFPWTNGQRWFKTNGWHGGNALDFQPVNHASYTNASSDLAVLAAEAGRVSKVCDDGYQVMLKVEHSGFVTQYLHIHDNSTPASIIGQQVPRGMYLGHLYTGTAGGGSGWRFNTSCGYATGINLHFVLSSRSATVCNVSAESIASSAFASIYTSCNSGAVQVTNPGKPTLTAPTANQEFQPGNITVTWNRGTLNWTGKYNTQIQISEVSDFSRLEYNKWVSGTQQVVSLPDDGNYWIRIRQGDTVDRNSGWTSTVKFSVVSPPPPCPYDLNNDRQVTTDDVQIAVSEFGSLASVNTVWDFDNDNLNTILDIQQIANAVGTICQQ